MHHSGRCHPGFSLKTEIEVVNPPLRGERIAFLGPWPCRRAWPVAEPANAPLLYPGGRLLRSLSSGTLPPRLWLSSGFSGGGGSPVPAPTVSISEAVPWNDCHNAFESGAAYRFRPSEGGR